MTDRWRNLLARARDCYERHHRVFWALHSLWALVTGFLVVILAHNSDGYAAWVVGFLALTWLSTVLFARGMPPPQEEWAARMRHGIAAYVTRVMYQETLFFLLPFYFYSCTLDSPNLLFLVLLAALAVFSCLDLLFDRLLRHHPWFGYFFFGVVSFAALNFLLPLVFGLSLGSATTVAAVVGLIASIPMINMPAGSSRWRLGAILALPALAAAVVLLWLRVIIPPVPLRLEHVDFARDINRETIELIEPLPQVDSPSTGGNRLAFAARIFAPRRVAARVKIHWWRNGQLLKTSRQIEINPYEGGFRVWDLYSPEEGPLPAGDYTVVIRTVDDQLIGRGSLRWEDRR